LISGEAKSCRPSGSASTSRLQPKQSPAVISLENHQLEHDDLTLSLFGINYQLDSTDSLGPLVDFSDFRSDIFLDINNCNMSDLTFSDSNSSSSNDRVSEFSSPNSLDFLGLDDGLDLYSTYTPASSDLSYLSPYSTTLDCDGELFGEFSGKLEYPQLSESQDQILGMMVCDDL
jgi:hypothetical protein